MLLMTLLFASIAAPSRADELIIRNGMLLLVTPLATIGQGGSGAILSPDGKTAYFVRAVQEPEVALPFDGEPTEICRVTVPSGKIDVLLRPRGSSQPEENLRGFSNLALALDGRTLYFLAAAWGTTSAVHALDLQTGTVSFLTPGNDVMVVPRGDYRGHLLVEKHKYFVAGGSYDHYWLVDHDGHEIGPAGDDRRQVLNRFFKP